MRKVLEQFKWLEGDVQEKYNYTFHLTKYRNQFTDSQFIGNFN